MRAWSSWKNRSGRDRCYRIIFKSPGTGSGYPDCVLISFCRILQLVESSLLYHRELGGAFVWLCLLVAVGFYSVKPPGCFMWMCFIYTPHYRNPGPLTQLLPFRSVFRKKKKLKNERPNVLPSISSASHAQLYLSKSGVKCCLAEGKHFLL